MKISKDIIRYATRHILKNGDTDIFPFPLELKFYNQKLDVIVESLAAADYSSFAPQSLIESLIPKTKFGFRVAHQPYPSDLIIFTALVCSIIEAVEVSRSDTADGTAFSYRKQAGLNGDFFVKDRHFKDWILRALLGSVAQIGC